MALQTVHVLATTPDGTRAGARQLDGTLARQRHTSIVLLVTAPDEWETARCVRVAREFNPWMPIRVRQGPNVTEAIKQAVPTLALAVIGGPARRWWPTFEQRLSDRLRRHGRDTVFVQETATDRAQPSSGLNVRESRPAFTHRIGRATVGPSVPSTPASSLCIEVGPRGRPPRRLPRFRWPRLRPELTGPQVTIVDALKAGCPGYAVMRPLMLGFRSLLRHPPIPSKKTRTPVALHR